MQIIVLGMHRSGTSLVTRLINMMGAWFAPEEMSMGFNRFNPKGYWERKDVMQCNMGIFKTHRVSWANVANWPLPHHPGELPQALWQDIKTIVLNMDAHRPWVMKDPRMCLTFPYWKSALEVPVCVVVHRDPLEIAQSLFNRDAMPLVRGLALWEFYAASLLNASASLPRIFVSHADFLKDPVKATATLHAALVEKEVQGLRLPHAREIMAFIDTALYNAKPEKRDRETHAYGENQKALIEMMQGRNLPAHELAVPETARTLLHEPMTAAQA